MSSRRPRRPGTSRSTPTSAGSGSGSSSSSTRRRKPAAARKPAASRASSGKASGRSSSRSRTSGASGASPITRLLDRLGELLAPSGPLTKAQRRRRALGTLAGGLVGILILVALGAWIAEQRREDAEGFQAGRIIEDRDFFAGGTMSAEEIQRFLESKVSSCGEGGACLRDYVVDLPEYPETERCDRVAPRPGATAAQVIADVGKACDISERVLLVMLEKEQSLVSNADPDPQRYDRAMGYFCPDDPSRPGWCDPEYGGFANQVYYAAAQFQRYRLEPWDYDVIAGRENQIAYHPNAPECGTATVYVENQATAGLYNYTPYVPNAAALDPATPDGDACSAFGNRNFWLFYETWFGEHEKRVVAPAPAPTA